MTERKVPTYRRHKSSGQAVVTLTDPASRRRRDVLLGKYGSAASRAEYARVLAEWEAAGRRLPAGKSGRADLTVNELVQAFWAHVQQHYRHPDGAPTSEVKDYRLSLRVLRYLYGATVAREFGPLALKAVRQLMIDGYDHPRHGAQPALSRGVVNQRVGRIRRAFKWASENELIPSVVHHALRDVAGLARGRSPAHETEPVLPVADAVVEATLPHLSRHVRAMVEVQRLTGMRPGEVCALRACDLDTTGKVWLYRPGSDQGPHGQHKTAHHGKARVVAIGPRAQAILRDFLTLDLQACLFSPMRALEEVRAERRALRKTRVQPSQQNRRRKKPRRQPGERWTTNSYDHAITAACARAFPAPEPLEQREDETARQWQARLTAEQQAELKAWRREHAWHPHQLRHSHATEVRRRFGLEAAQAALGHSKADVTQIYAERDLALAAKVAAELG